MRAAGHGGAVAQAYAHPIIPLCNAADRRTQLSWGLADFRRRFGRAAEGLWLPETAASADTLETLIELGVRYTILAPEQIAAVRASARDEWQQVDRDSVDTGRAYLWRHRDGSGRTIAVGVFDGPLSRAIAFGDTANRAESLMDAVKASADRSSVHGQRLVLCTSDGELWGHHKKFADLTLSFATRIEAARRGFETTNLGAYLERHPPVWEMQLAEGPDGQGTAWSCGHGVGRWQRDCGCNMGGPNAGNQKWRGPLRAALDIIRDAAAALYADAAGDCSTIRGARATTTARSSTTRRTCVIARWRSTPRSAGRRAPRRGCRRASCWSCSGRRCSCTRAAAGSSTTSPGWSRRW